MRLTNLFRERLARLIIEEQFAAGDKELEQREHQVAEAVYRQVYDEVERRRMQRLPAGWLKERDEIQVSGPGRNWVVLKFARPTRFQAQTGQCALSFDDVVGLWAIVTEFAEQRRDRGEERQRAKQQIKTVLASVHTLKRLYEVWPEARPFAERLSPEAKQLPAVPVGKLNELLGLGRAA